MLEIEERQALVGEQTRSQLPFLDGFDRVGTARGSLGLGSVSMGTDFAGGERQFDLFRQLARVKRSSAASCCYEIVGRVLDLLQVLLVTFDDGQRWVGLACLAE